MSFKQPEQWNLSIKEEAFNALTGDFDKTLLRTLSGMLSRNGEIAELTVKLKITLHKEMSSTGRDVVVPKFEHKVGATMQFKSEQASGSLAGKYELVWDAENSSYVMREIIDPQLTLLEDEEEKFVEYTPLREDDKPAVPLILAGLAAEATKVAAGCAKDFPECLCQSCMRNDCIDLDLDKAACCVRHGRECQWREEGCSDYVNSFDCNGYAYDSPQEEGKDANSPEVE